MSAAIVRSRSNVSLGVLMFAVMTLNKTVELSVAGQEISLPLAYADGMVGAIPVFSTRDAAKKFAAGNCGVLEVRITPVTIHGHPGRGSSDASEEPTIVRDGHSGRGSGNAPEGHHQDITRAFCPGLS